MSRKIKPLVPAPKPWTFTVRIEIEVDAPELRSPSMPVVAKGTRVPWRITGTREECITIFDKALDGEWDFIAEYVATVSVVAQREGEVRRIRDIVNRATGWHKARRESRQKDFAKARKYLLRG